MAALNGRRRRLLAALLSSAALAACDRGDRSTSRPQFHATDITGADFGRHLELPDQDGRVRTLDDFKGIIS